MAYYKWYITEVSRPDKTGNTWAPQETSLELDVWFGVSPPPDQSLYDIVILDPNGNNLVESAEIRAAIGAYLSTNETFNPSTVSSDFTQNPAFSTIIFATGNINQALTAFVLTDDPLTAPYTVDYQPGTGNFSPIDPGSLQPEPAKPDGVVDGTLGDDLIDLNYTGDGEGDRIDNSDHVHSPGNDSLGTPGSNDDFVKAYAGDDTVIAGLGNDTVYGGLGNDSLSGGDGIDSLFGDEGNDFLDGGDGADILTGGEGYDTFVAGDGDTITGFNTGSGDINDGVNTNNDFVDVSEYYNEDNLATINAQRVANGLPEYQNPLQWLRADQEDGVLNDIRTTNGFDVDFTMTIQGTTPDGLTFDTTAVVCFSADALIETQDGPVRAGDLQVGDMVRTRDSGMQPIRWIGTKLLSAQALEANPKLRPIRIRAGALAQNTPSRDLVVSPQHRVLVRSRIAHKMFGTDEVLVAAKQLCQVDGIDIAHDLDSVTYVHFLFDDHQIVFSNGAETESLHTGDEALESVGPAAREEIFALFPELRDGPARTPARILASGRLGRRLAVRHIQNGRPLVN